MQILSGEPVSRATGSPDAPAIGLRPHNRQHSTQIRIEADRSDQAGDSPMLTTCRAGLMLVDRKFSPGVLWFGSGETPVGELGVAPAFGDVICARAAWRSS